MMSMMRSTAPIAASRSISRPCMAPCWSARPTESSCSAASSSSAGGSVFNARAADFASKSSSYKRSKRSSAATAASSIFAYPLAQEPKALYDHPELYEAAFSYRDMKQEVRFLKELYAKHAGGAPLTSVLELGCGPASHSIGLARSGVPKVFGLDLSDEMLKYARWKFEATGGKLAPSAGAAAAKAKGFGAAPAPQDGLRLVKGNMADFKVSEEPLDMVMCLLGTFSHMLDNDQASSSFACAARQLRPGGLLVLELAHPGDLFDGTFIIGDGGKEVWEVPVGTTHKILVEWGAEFDNFDPVTQVLHRTVSVNVLKGDDVEQALEEVVLQRQFTVQEIKLLAGMHGLELQEMYGEMALEVDLSHEEAYRMIAVLKKL